MIKQGDVFKHGFSFTQADVEKFAAVTGDDNPVHLDADYAAKTMFKKPIMHGFLGSSIFSKVFGTLFPGEGTIYLSQSMKFMKPMYVGINYEAVFEVTEANHEKHRAKVRTTVVDPATGDLTIEGEASVMNLAKI